MTAAVLRLKRGHDRPLVHPWIFKGDVADVTNSPPGSVVTVIDAAGRFIGRAHFNPKPALCARILTRADEPIDGAFYRRRLAAALAVRPASVSDHARAVRPASVAGSAAVAGSATTGDSASLRSSPADLGGAPGSSGAPPDQAPPEGPASRLVWSEADLVPGLVVDRYADVLVVQCQTLAMAQARGEIAAALRAQLGELPIFALDDAVAARFEGFEPARGWLDWTGPEQVVVREGRVRFSVAIGGGHKTGLYVDQAENRRSTAPLAAGRHVLDAFCFTAGFACHALLAGAVRALCLESSPEAIAGARENLTLNAVAERAEIRAVNVFDELRSLERSGERFGLVILDPPPFARSRTALEAAARGYKEINLRAMRLLEPGGHLMTFSCSHHVSDGAFEEICREASTDAGVTLRVVASLTQASDHPVLLTVPETRYLTGRLLQAV